MTTLGPETAGRFASLAIPVNDNASIRHYGETVKKDGKSYSVQMWPRRNEIAIFPGIVSPLEGSGANPSMTMGVTIINLDGRDPASHYVVGGGKMVRVFPYQRVRPDSGLSVFYDVQPSLVSHVANLAEDAFELSPTPTNIKP